MHIQFAAKSITPKSTTRHAIVLNVSDSLVLGSHAAALDKLTKGVITKTLKSGAFEGKAGQIEVISGMSNVDASRIVVVGSGKDKSLSAASFQRLGGYVTAALNAHKIASAEWHLDVAKSAAVKPGTAAAQAALGAHLRNYAFLTYHTTRKKELTPSLSSLTIVSSDDKAAKSIYQSHYAPLAESITFARNLVTEPGNIIYPETLAKQCQTLSKLGVKVEVLGRAQMEKLGMGSLLGVAQGSVREPKLVVMQWMGGKKSQKPLGFVGKGVTFDTGGISIKPAPGMEDMKYDMAGSAAVIGLMRTLAARKAKVNAVGVVGLVENMPDGNAQRPGDVVTSMSGQTIEVLNTDAEGRLVLADALWYTQQRFKPQFMINLATLTGAIVVALGSSRAGLFSNNDALVDKLMSASEASDEKVWRLPLGEEYDKQINSDIADMRNIGDGREAGSVTAAQFLQRFVNNTPWAHLDIAGVAWSGKGKPTAPKGATGFGIRLLDQLVHDHYEGKA